MSVRSIAIRLLVFGTLFTAASCQPSPPAALPVPTNIPAASQTAEPAESPTIPPQTPTTAPTTGPRDSAKTTEICSPLEGITLKELPSIESNPYDPPEAARDDGHHGTDFAFYSRGELTSMQGLPVNSVLTGKVAAAISDRPPYGNFVIVETPLELLPPSLSLSMYLPTPYPAVLDNPRLQCPPVDLPAGEGRSLYLLYAHLENPSGLEPGQPIGCGQQIGEVGNSGASGNPHLHLEVRVGPGGGAFPAMAHYINDATLEEMGYYCAWRISGRYQMVDPFDVLNLFLLGEDPFPLSQ